MNSPEPKIVYMGSAEFAVPALGALAKAGCDVTAVVTQPDRARGRGGRLSPTPVGLYAEIMGLPMLKPERLKDNEEFMLALRDAAPDLIVVAAYGKLLPTSVLELPAFGCVNIHASLLPEYRGAAPVQRAILDGKKETGVTLIHMNEGLDAGDIIAAARVDISDMTAGLLTGVLAVRGAELLRDTLPMLMNGTAPRIPQDGSKATYAEKVVKAEGRLDFTQTADSIVLRVRAMAPAPGAYVMNDGERIGVTAARALGGSGGIVMDHDAAAPGTVVSVSKQGIAVRAGDGIVLIEALKAPGRKSMSVEEYLKGNVFDAKSL